MSWQARLEALLQCGYRPFFLLSAASACCLMLFWLTLLNGWINWQPPGGMVLWHVHELLFGFAGAAIAGFLLTAVPEFTETANLPRTVLVRLALLWLLARVLYLLSPFWPASLALLPVALVNLLFWLLLLWHLLPRLWQHAGRMHLSFAWVVASLALLQLASLLANSLGGDPMAWLRAASGVLMMLIVIATRRISGNLVNGLIEEGRPGAPPPINSYLPRPPRSYLALFCIGLCSAVELWLGHNSITGWTALAAAAAMLNVLNDWHIGRALFTRWALLLYAGYWLIALGYAAMGASWLGAPLTTSAGRHLLTSGAAALSILAVMAVVGRIHAGLWLDRRPWLPLCALGLIIAAVLRALAGVPGLPIRALFSAAGLVWAGCFVAYLVAARGGLIAPRADGKTGCAAPLEHNAREGGC